MRVLLMSFSMVFKTCCRLNNILMAKKISVHIKLGHRYLYQEQAEQLTDLIASKKDLVVHSIDSEVIAKEEAQRMKEEQEIVSVSKIVRSRCFT